MKLESIKSKIVVPVATILVLHVLILTIYYIVELNNYSASLYNDRVAITACVLDSHMKELENRSRSAALSVSSDADVIKAISTRDRKKIIKILLPHVDSSGIDFFTVTDERGKVLARTNDPEKYGDSLLKEINIENALRGEVFTCHEEGTVVKVSARTGAPVYGLDGKLKGVISAGIRLDANEALGRLKHHLGMDNSTFMVETKIVSATSENGERITSGQFSTEVRKVIFEDKKRFFGNVDIQGANYSAYIFPLINHEGEVFALFFAGHSNARLIAKRNALIINGILFGLAGLAISIVILLMITTVIVRPIERLKHMILDVVGGNIKVDPSLNQIADDEVGELTGGVYSLVLMLKSITEGLRRLLNELNAYGDTYFRIDTSKFQGVFIEIVDSIQALVDSFPKMNQVMTVMENLENMVMVVDFDYNLVFINKNMANAYGVDRSNYVGKKCYKEIRNNDQPCSFCKLPELLLNKDVLPYTYRETLYDEKMGEWVGGRASIIQWVDGSMVYFQSLNNETEKIKQQEQLHDAMKAAQDASEAKSQFLANMSHEIRTPMNAVLGMSELLLQEDLNSRQHNYAEDIRTSAMALLGIINDILDVSKLQAGKLVLIPVHYDFKVLIENISSMANFLLEGKEVEFQLIMEEQEHIYLYGDDVRTRQILINLIGNAIKFTHEGYVRLEVIVTDDTIKIIVSDTGIGIPAENIPTLFDAFEQADIEKNRFVKGTGLGLTITKAILEMMGGSITVESVYGKGSTFNVEIPKVTGDETLMQVVDDKETVIYAPEAKVLVVDDIPSNLNVATGLLGICKINAETASSGSQAIEMIRQKDYDIVFMDNKMPGLSGVETTRMLRQMGIKVPIIALTASAVVGTREKMLAAGMDDYLWKPIIKKDLIGILKKWIPAEKLVDPTTLTASSGTAETEEQREFWSRVGRIDELSLSIGLERVGGMRNVLQKSLRLMILDMEKCDINLKKFLSSGDMENFRIQVHGMKSALACIGAMELSALAYELEMASNEAGYAFCVSNLLHFLAGLNELKIKLKEAFSIIDHSDGPIIVPPEAPLFLKKLIDAFKEIDVVEIEKNIEALDSLNLCSALKEELEQLKDKILIMDYDSATEQIKKLLGLADQR